MDRWRNRHISSMRDIIAGSDKLKYSGQLSGGTSMLYVVDYISNSGFMHCTLIKLRVPIEAHLQALDTRIGSN